MENNINRLVIVTGGAQGIGLAVATELCTSGYTVAVIDCDKEAIEEAASCHPGIEFHLGDISQKNNLDEFLNKIDCSNLYALINNAAISKNKPLTKLNEEEWQEVLSVNLTAPFLLVRATSEYLRKNKGAVVNIASTRALMSEKNTEAYAASKGGILALTHALAVSLAPDIRVNAISPGWIETTHLKKKSERTAIVHSEADKMQHPCGRVGTPEDISGMVKYLISDKAGFITGQNFIVDGGMTIKMIYE